MVALALPMHLLSLLWSYPEIILSLACFFLFFCLSRRWSPSLVPVNWPVLGMLPTVLANFHNLHDYIADALREVGCTFTFKGPWLLGMDFVLTCDPANVAHIFNASFSNYPKGDEFAEIFDILGDGLFNADGESWHAQRKAAHTFMGAPSFRRFVASITREKVTGGVFPVLDDLAKRGKPVDMQDLFTRVSFDVTCAMVFGVDPGSVSVSFPTVAFAKAMDEFWEALFLRHVLPMRLWKTMRRLNLGKERTLAKASEVIDCFIAQRIAERRKEKSEPRDEGPTAASDLLSSYMKHPVGGGEGIFGTDEFLRDTVLTLMLAGRDGFSITLSWLYYLLFKNPHVEKKILDELSAHAAGRKQEARGSPVVFGMEDISSMVYLHAAVLETLRLYPPVPYEHKAVRGPDVLPSGHSVRKGMKIVLSIYAMGRMEGLWGKDCMEFKPERWISGEGRLRHEPAYKFMAFNSGPRICLGKDLGMIQIKTVAAAMLWNYEVDVVDGAKVMARNAVLLKVKGLVARVRSRKFS